MKTIYISHPYGGKWLNKVKAGKIIRKLQAKYPFYVFVSPIHNFSFANYKKTDYDLGMDWCLGLLSKCDEMWLCGDWKSSKGCRLEYDFCIESQIKVKFLGEV